MSAAPQEVMTRGRAAQTAANSWSQQLADRAVAAAGWAVYEESRARALASLALSETGIGDVEETYARMRRRVLGTLRDLNGVASVGVVEEDRSRGLRKYAKPAGLIAAMTPTTAPVAAVAQNVLMALKTRNAIVICPHPRAVRSASTAVELIRDALDRIGAPRDLVQCIPDLNRERSCEVMSSVDLILAAGGEGVVRRASTSGKPTWAAGTGNAVVIIDETADVAEACTKVFQGKHFDNGTSCSSESSLLVADEVWFRVLEELRHARTHLCDRSEAERLSKIMWPDGKSLSRAVVGKHAETIAQLAGISVPAGTRVLMVTPESPPGVDVFSREKLSPVLALWKFQHFDEAVEQVGCMTDLSGRGHSCGIFSARPERVERLASAVRLSRVMVNQSTGIGNSGDFANGMPFTTTLCCGTWGGSASSENITWRHLLNYTWVSEPVSVRDADPNLLFAAHWAAYGRG